MKNKNIWLLPTDKPSRLVTIDGNLYFGKNEREMMSAEFLNIQSQNIYITSSDEEIKMGDWYTIEFNGIPITKCTSEEELISIEGRNDCQKIILTTDDQLIKDGVQAIDDEFLEWFVKNPSCELVEIIQIEDELISPKNPKIRFNALQDPPSFVSAESLNNMILTYKYKIIIKNK